MDDRESSRWEKAGKFLLKWHLPLMLLFALMIGYLVPSPARRANDKDLQGICFPSVDACVYDTIGSLLVSGIFFISGLKLKTQEIRDAVSAWKAGVFGMISILFLTPCMAFLVVRADFGGVPEFSVGLGLFLCVPTTLSSGVIIADQANGNVALALLLTVLTNSIGVLTAPIFVRAMLDMYDSPQGMEYESSSTQVKIEIAPMILKLCAVILLPLALGKALRNFQRVRDFAKTYGVELKVLSSVMLALIPWMKIGDSASDLKSVGVVALVLVWLTSIAVHLLYLVGNYGACRAFKFKQAEMRTVVIVSSQKTLPVSITILDFLPPELIGSPGIVAIPIIVAHLMQILLDAFLAARWASMPIDS